MTYIGDYMGLKVYSCSKSEYDSIEPKKNVFYLIKDQMIFNGDIIAEYKNNRVNLYDRSRPYFASKPYLVDLVEEEKPAAESVEAKRGRRVEVAVVDEGPIDIGDYWKELTKPVDDFFKELKEVKYDG